MGWGPLGGSYPIFIYAGVVKLADTDGLAPSGSTQGHLGSNPGSRTPTLPIGQNPDTGDNAGMLFSGITRYTVDINSPPDQP
jgi:hypothetical protein